MVHRTPRGIEVEVFLPKFAVGTGTPDDGTPGPDATPRPGNDPPVLERPGPWPPNLAIPPAPTLDTDLLPTTKPGAATRGLIDRAEEVAGDLANEQSPLAVSQRRVRELAEAVLEDAVQERLARLDVERLADLVDGQSRIGTLVAGGVTTVAQVVDHHDLTSIPGIGRTTTKRLEGAAHQVAALVRDSLGLRFDVDARPADHTRLLAQLRHHHTLRQVEPALAARAAGARTTLRAAATAAQPAARGFVARLFSREDETARLAVVRLERALDGVRDDDLVTRVRQLFVVPDNRDSREAAWEWFEADPPVAYGLLEELAGLGAGHETQEGHLPSEIVAAVRRQRLDTRFLDVTLRGYQAFGARYALVQERVLIGDEMGLGKTIIALAVAAHLWAAGCRHVLVVCPASVLLNWRREIDTHSKMPSVHLHGDGRDAAYQRWRQEGGIAVTTFGTVGALPGPDPTDLLVADEAHYVKNPQAQRSQHVTGWGRHADRVLYLTGTPLENRVEEFRELVGQLRPDVAEPLDDHFVLAGSEAFRTKVAPVYLRRNQEDVLTELPPRLEVDDWVEPTTQDATAYRDAVATGNFQAMRQAAWVHASSGQSAKMQRLVEIIEESAAQGWKVVVFSYFLNTLAAIAEGLDGRVFGPLTGATSSADRLAMVDVFTDHDGPAVLVSQIIAGGVGLNIQAAPVVVLAEPQWKPSTEDQAIARAHRMGQVRRVNVHRLLVTPGVDQRMKELVAQKAAIFDEYARQSSVVEAAPDAVDRTEASMVQQIIDEESQRLGVVPAGPPESSSR
nr:DEAD/DEAH box helicase [Salsipaludibacter albus]